MRSKLKNTFHFCLFVLLLSACQSNSNSNTYEEEAGDSQSTYTGPDTSNGLYAMIYSSKGIMIAELFPDKAPMTVANFVALAEGDMPNTFRGQGEPYYDSLLFHRVISLTNGDKQNFMIQGGDPLGNGTGGPGYQFKDEFSDLRMNKPGVLAMANSGPGTNGSQFFITLDNTSWLDGKHTVFGQLIAGTSVPFLIKINDYMSRIKILRKGEEAKSYNALEEFNKRKQ